MSDCVKELFPSDYKRRIDIELKLENGHNAAILSVLLFLNTNSRLFIRKRLIWKILKKMQM